MRRSYGSWASGVAVVLAGAAAYEAAVALRWIAIGDVPGRGAPGADAVAIVGVVALLAGLVVSLTGARRPGAVPPVTRGLLPLVAASFVAATGLGFDPYYAPEHRRYSTNGGVPSTVWLGALGVAAVCAAALGAIHPRAGLLLTGLLMVVCLGTFVLTGSGH